MYINSVRFTKELIKWSVIMFPAFLGAFIFLGTAVDCGDWTIIPFFIAAEVFCIFILKKYIQNMFYLGWMRLLDRLFKQDADGSVPISEVSNYLATTPERVEKMRKYGEKTRILVNLVYDAEGKRFVLTDKSNAGVRMNDRPFVGLSCPGCGANLKIRSGAVGVCPYCDREVPAPNITIG